MELESLPTDRWIHKPIDRFTWENSNVDLGVQKDSCLMWAAGMPLKQPRATEAKKKASP